MKKLFALALMAMLGSCTQPSPDIRAKMVDGAVVFETYRFGAWPWSKDTLTNVRADRFAVFGREGVVWLIERDPNEPCRSGPRKLLFPLKYGQLPHCYVARVAPAPLVPGTLYQVETDIGDYASGVIRLTQGVENPKYDEFGDGLSNWPRESEPDIAYPRFGWGNTSDPENSTLPEDDVSSRNEIEKLSE